EGCDSTTELLPPSRLAFLGDSPLRRGRPAARARVFADSRIGGQARLAPLLLCRTCNQPSLVGLAASLACQPKLAAKRRAKVGGEGRTRTFEAARATDLQSAAFDRFATSPAVCVCLEKCCFPERF